MSNHTTSVGPRGAQTPPPQAPRAQAPRPQAPPPQTPLQTPPLRCLGGKTAKMQVKDDLARLALLPLEVLGQLWAVLGPLVGGDLTKERINRAAVPFCKRHALDIEDFMFGIVAARLVLRGAATEDLDVEQFVEDLEALEVAVPVAKVLAAGFDRAHALIRGELMMATLMDHGRVLKTTDWRIDQMRGSNRGKNLDAPVASLTFNFQDGDRAERLTLQVLPPVLKQLRHVLDELLSDGERPAEQVEAVAQA